VAVTVTLLLPRVLQCSMSQPSVSMFSVDETPGMEASPSKRPRWEDRKQFIGPSYIRMQALSFALSFSNLSLKFINPKDDRSIARAAKGFLTKVQEKAEIKGLQMQSRKGTKYGVMGGAFPILACAGAFVTLYVRV
jgi:hypothetical protein